MKRRSPIVSTAGLALLAGLVMLCTNASGQETRAQPVADFYRGKTIAIVIGYSVGGGFDIYARVLAHHIGRHIPGQPAVVPQNMPGAASLKSVEYLFAVAPRDGTAMGTFSYTIPIAPLLGSARFDPRALAWIGGPVASQLGPRHRKSG